MTPMMRSILQAAEQWAPKPLIQLQSQALETENGIAFDALRQSGGGVRTYIVCCITHAKAIKALEEGMSGGGISEDWSAMRLFDMIFRAEQSNGIYYDRLREEGQTVALAIAATQPKTVEFIEGYFNLPP